MHDKKYSSHMQSSTAYFFRLRRTREAMQAQSSNNTEIPPPWNKHAAFIIYSIAGRHHFAAVLALGKERKWK